MASGLQLIHCGLRYSAGVDPTTSPLTDAEWAWLVAQERAAEQFLADYGSARFPPGLAAFDHAWASWMQRQEVDPGDPNPIINAVGAMIGQRLADYLDGFDWVIATDDEGTDLAVAGSPGGSNVLIYPANVVAKRYESRETWFLQSVYAGIVADVGQLRA